MKFLTKFLTPLSWVLPRHMEQGAGGATPGSGGDPAAGAVANPAALAQAEEIERLNARIREMDSNRAEEIRQEAERLLMEVMPEIGEGNGARVPALEPEPEQRAQRRPPANGEDGGEQDVQSQILEHLQRLEQRQVALEENLVGNTVDQQLSAAKAKHPMMDEVRVRLYLANLGEAAEKVNLDTLCRISHEKEQQRLEQYHLQRIASTQAAGNPAPASGNPPALPGRPSAVPAAGVPITAQNAARVLTERLRAMGFERQT